MNKNHTKFFTESFDNSIYNVTELLEGKNHNLPTHTVWFRSAFTPGSEIIGYSTVNDKVMFKIDELLKLDHKTLVADDGRLFLLRKLKTL